ncbi:hypothetical protein GCWU000282_03261 [Catonella morbi ATCC 51271]|uniref:Uncharacterized protein n=1 Tax=Catonella morbi ATCC 51271 TaxID=592026 RepID=V2Z460_9FIRM|nr:hypothetical protein GCWU000282_03261 [Catonella morbi ATCC 51271]
MVVKEFILPELFTKHLVKYRNQTTGHNHDILQMFGNITPQLQNENSSSYRTVRKKRSVTYEVNNLGFIYLFLVRQPYLFKIIRSMRILC